MKRRYCLLWLIVCYGDSSLYNMMILYNVMMIFYNVMMILYNVMMILYNVLMILHSIMMIVHYVMMILHMVMTVLHYVIMILLHFIIILCHDTVIYHLFGAGAIQGRWKRERRRFRCVDISRISILCDYPYILCLYLRGLPSKYEHH